MLSIKDVLGRIWLKLKRVKASTENSPKWATLWRVPNRIWDNGFAPNKKGDALHPGLILQKNPDNISCKIIPGTTKEYNVGKCVFKTRLRPDLRNSYFLIDKRITISNEDILGFQHGWSSVTELNEDQKDGLYRQARVCIDMKLDIRPKMMQD